MKMDRELQFKQEFIDLYSELELDALLDKIADKICDYLDSEESAIFLYDPTRESLYFFNVTGKNREQLKKIVMRKGEGIVGWVAERGEPLIVNDCANDPRFTAVTDIQTNFVTHSLIAVPVVREGKFLGVLECINKKDGRFCDADLQLLLSIANYISIPLQNAMLFQKVKVEAKERMQLIELGKIVSRSFSLEEVFSVLKEIIYDLIVPIEINVMVKSQNKTYKLIRNEKTTYQDKGVEETTIDAKQAVFPLRTTDKLLGYLEIRIDRKIPAEAMSLIRGTAIFAAISIDKYEMHLRMLEKERLEQELEIARKIQQSFLLNEKVRINGIDTAYINIPSSAVGGDYYDIVALNKDETIFTVNDISGHGIPASLLMSIFRANFSYRIKKDNNILTTITHLNDLVAETTEANLFVTSFTCSINPVEMSCAFINAGHNPPYLFRDSQVIELRPGATVLGWFTEVRRKVKKIDLKEGDVLFLYTDGVIEAENPDGKDYTSARLQSFLQKCIKLNMDVETIKNQLIEELKEYVQSTQFEDDVTFIIIKMLKAESK